MKKREYILKKISPLAIFKTSTMFLAAIIGLIGIGVILATSLKGWKAFGDAVLGTLFGVFILSPIYGLVSAIVAIIYNWVAKKTGGYRLTFEVNEIEK